MHQPHSEKQSFLKGKNLLLTVANSFIRVGSFQNKCKIIPTELAPLTVYIMGTLSGETILSKLFCLPSEKGSILKGKNLLLME